MLVLKSCVVVKYSTVRILFGKTKINKYSFQIGQQSFVCYDKICYLCTYLLVDYG